MIALRCLKRINPDNSVNLISHKNGGFYNIIMVFIYEGKRNALSILIQFFLNHRFYLKQTSIILFMFTNPYFFKFSINQIQIREHVSFHA